jgi:uncharacterized protein (DUF1697 family)
VNGTASVGQDGGVRYVALLRGVNVGGNTIVDMSRLKGTFERLGFQGVRTYINSGNVVFTITRRERTRLTREIEAGIVADFGLDISLQLRTGKELRALVDAIPASWANDSSMKCDVHFLWPAVDHPSVVDRVPHDPAIEEVRYFPGALIRRIDRANQSKSPMTKVAATPLYRQMTARNINTVRKLAELAAEEPTGGAR